MVCEDRANSKTCPECGSRLAVENRSHDGVAVTLAVCTGYPDCTYFCWLVPEDSRNPHRPPAFGELGSWAIDESLSVLHDELSSREWRKALATPGNPPEEGGTRRG